MSKKELENAYLQIIHKIPDYSTGIKKISKRKIQEVMLEYGYDLETVEEISDEEYLCFSLEKEAFPESQTFQFIKDVVVNRVTKLLECDSIEAEGLWEKAINLSDDKEESCNLNVSGNFKSASISYGAGYTEHIAVIPCSTNKQ